MSVTGIIVFYLVTIAVGWVLGSALEVRAPRAATWFGIVFGVFFGVIAYVAGGDWLLAVAAFVLCLAASTLSNALGDRNPLMRVFANTDG
jgi:uncharacterized membrane protein YjjP (DUF1212 family)